jgi:hypothetical protein
VGAANLTWRYLGKPKNFLSASAFSLIGTIKCDVGTIICDVGTI